MRLKVKVISRVWVFETWLFETMENTLGKILQVRILELVGSLSLLQGIFPTQGLNSGFLHCGQILYQLSHQGSPRIPKWIAYPFSGGSSQPRNWTRVSYIAGGFFTSWAIREAHNELESKSIILKPMWRQGSNQRRKKNPHASGKRHTELSSQKSGFALVGPGLSYDSSSLLGMVFKEAHSSSQPAFWAPFPSACQSYSIQSSLY